MTPAAEACKQDKPATAAVSIGTTDASTGSSGTGDATNKRAAGEGFSSSGSQTQARFSASAAAYEASCRHVTLTLECNDTAGVTRVGALALHVLSKQQNAGMLRGQ